MDYKQLSKRLHRVGELVPKNSILADIGSDHAYLPAYLVLQHKISEAIAGEVVEGPFLSAKKLINELNLTKNISVRKGDGLDVISSSDNVGTITICGMGGTLIRDILNRGDIGGQLTGKELLILQPNIGEQRLRYWLSTHNYQVVTEDIIRENDKTYVIISAKKGREPIPLTEKEILFGPILLKDRNPLFIDKWRHELKQFEVILTQLKKSNKDVSFKTKDIQNKIKLIKEVIQ